MSVARPARPPEPAPPDSVRLAEALIFCAPAPMTEADLAARLPPGTDVPALLAEIARTYAPRGITLARVAGGYAFRTAPDLAPCLRGASPEPRKLSRAALETLAIVAYHQPVTRAEIEEIRGVTTSKGSLDLLLETGWVRLRGRRRTPGRPVTYGTTPAFLDHFGLDAVSDLPGLDELKGLGLIEGRLPAGVRLRQPSDTAVPDEDPLAPGEDAAD
ncbi:SMC-Scp complex subunit ScpB [Methylobacterium nonmethylotrophicum]|uniref:SMC-Scp complex subunit ScpB n=1 Tax=Methylobacterium nonmethylotrophicum TaxID=1141884 RepID=A0A4Z0NX78_9HYPH|nr:SMC-Scp complex subunit ScpB [Methylobacterium nonmethylotrophicum]TGE01924.1 SMC-Scp complex subunit ScpB [Methylobacterium nonmethylotrophicum]